MKRQFLSYFVALPALMLALSTQAHDPNEHANESQAPDCAAMESMDHTKMDMNDPVTQAMMQKCMQQDKEVRQEGHADHSKTEDMKEPTKNRHK